MASRQRQEVLNVVLAQLLQDRGVVVAPESIMYTGTQRVRQMPDVLVSYQGLRTAIEGEYEAANARQKAISSAISRVETGLAHIGIGVVYPAGLRGTNFASLPAELSRAQLQIAVATEAGTSGFTTGDVNDLERILRNTFEQLVREDVVAEAVALLDVAVDRFAEAVISYKGIWGRITADLTGEISDSELDTLTIGQRAANCRIGGLVLMNAMIFHDVLSSHYPRISPLSRIISSKPMESFISDWTYILEEVNYYSIFSLARSIMSSLSASPVGLPETIIFMAETAQKISERRAALRHDLMGRIYHRLLAEAKYLGTYYTSIPAATLLLKLALRPSGMNTEWNDVNKIGNLRIADLACGTGTLLMAAADTIIDNYVSSAAASATVVDLPSIHKQIAEEILHGYDVLPSAIHLTASTIALRSPEVPVDKMHLYALPLGGTDNRLGSLEFLSGNLMAMPLDLFGALPEPQAPKGVSGSKTREQYIIIPDLDLCVMNPPFVRSVGGNLLFGSLPAAIRAEMQTRLRRLVQTSGVQASITSGLGSVFVAIGDRSIKDQGRLALVLPKALLSGVSWSQTRSLINSRYAVDYVVSSHDPERWNFSESTDLSEVLLVATKYGNLASTNTKENKTIAVNLWRNPTNALEALTLASQIQRANPPDLVEGHGASNLILNGEKAGEIVSYSWQEMKTDWFLPCAFAQSDLTRTAYNLLHGVLKLPTPDLRTPINLCSLLELGSLGPDRRDIHDGFDLATGVTNYPSFWGHNAETMIAMAQAPNRYLEPLSAPKNNRPLRKLSDLWPLAGKVLLAERMRLNTQRLVAVRLEESVLSNVWWSFSFNDSVTKTDADKVLVLWLNSTLAQIILIATRDETEGAWVDFKKPSLGAMPVLDIRKLSDEQFTTLTSAYDRLGSLELKPLPQMVNDEVRAEIDAAIMQALNLPDFSILKRMLAREPVVCMERI